MTERAKKLDILTKLKGRIAWARANEFLLTAKVLEETYSYIEEIKSTMPEEPAFKSSEAKHLKNYCNKSNNS